MKNSPKNLVKVYRPHRVVMRTSPEWIFVKSGNADLPLYTKITPAFLANLGQLGEET